MKLIKLFILVFSASLFLTGCGAKKKVKTSEKTQGKTVYKNKPSKKKSFKTKELSVSNKNINLSTKAYIEKYADIAVNQMRIHHIPASITLAQGILESRSGNSDLTKVSNNHFGIKCHKGWEGAFVKYDDDNKDECFRVYDNPENSFEDHSNFLTGRKRYAKLFRLKKTDFKGWAKGLRKAGYATDKKYPKKLIQIIEKYELYKYDEQVLGTSVSNDSNIYIVQQGDGLYRISKKYNMKLSELMHINNLTSSNIYPGQRLKLKPEVDKNGQKEIIKYEKKSIRSKKNPKKHETVDKIVKTDTIPQENKQTKLNYHIVQEGETLYQIAYKYKLAVPDLRRWNGVRKNEIRVGQKVFIANPRTSDPNNVNTGSHTVIQEDTLYSIAKRYQTTVPELMRLNNLKNYTIYIGQVLVVK